MRAPSRIALFGASALSLASFVTSVLGQLIRLPHRRYEIANVVGFAGIEAILFGVLVWVGTYIGARLAPAHQRTDRLVRVVVLTYVVVAVLLSLPIETHAVMLDVPKASSGAVLGTMWIGFAFAVGALVAVVVLFIVITRVLAAALQVRNNGDA